MTELRPHSLRLVDEWGERVRCLACGQVFASPAQAVKAVCRLPVERTAE